MMRLKRKVNPWTLAITAAFYFGLSVFWQIINYSINGEFQLTRIIGSFLAAAPLALANAIYVYRKKDKTPIIDTRVRNNMIKYIAFASQIVFILFMVALIIASFSGMEAIPTIYLWVAVGINMAVIGIGALIVQFK